MSYNASASAKDGFFHKGHMGQLLINIHDIVRVRGGADVGWARHWRDAIKVDGDLATPQNAKLRLSFVSFTVLHTISWMKRLR